MKVSRIPLITGAIGMEVLRQCMIKTDLPRNCNEIHQEKLSATLKENQEIAEYQESNTVTERSFREYYPKIWHLGIWNILI